MLPAMAAMWIPSAVVPPWMSATSDISTCWKYCMARLRFPRASTHACTTPLSVDPCEVRWK